ncbi:MAG TPA: TIGR03960 family B12-binding radical SAM protein, partial [Candidatus Cloacimonadota bacterium]|nr:TIGR03960 family B12-binding radical SAM protein [Candidatus Cloacimonadota bacterium]
MKFDKVEFQPLLFSVNKPSRYIDHEINALHKVPSNSTINFCLAFPDVYEVGMSHLGLKILYSILNQQEDSVADRVYAPWPDFGELLKSHALPLFGVESKMAVSDFDVLGFTLQSELNFTNILYMLDLAGIPLKREDRTDSHPIVIAGGPCATNPYPLSLFIDAFLIGEGEEAILEIKDAVKQHRHDRKAILHAFSQIEGMFVPSAQFPVPSSQFPSATRIRKYTGFSEYQMTHENQLIPWQHATHDRYVAEIMRGCTRGCRFCHAGFFYRPARERKPEEIIRHVLEEVRESGWEEAALVSLSSSDYSCIKPLLLALHQQLKDNGATISLPSLRVDSLDNELVKLINAVGRAGLTVAPEAGSQRLRNIINKNITEEDILQGVHIALENGWQLMKLYFMIGLPGEEEEDITAIVELVEKIISISKKKLQINVSLSPFVPKPFTPFQWSGMLDRVELLKRALIVKHDLSRYRFVKVKYHQIESSIMEAALCRGNEETGLWMLEAYQLGAKFDGWHEYFDFDIWEKAAENLHYNWRQVLQALPTDQALPWDHIEIGVSREYLLQEWEHSQQGNPTGDCREEGCLNCGVCHDEIQMDVLTNSNNVETTDPGVSSALRTSQLSSALRTSHFELRTSLFPSATPQSPVTSNQKPSAFRIYYSKMDDLRFISHLDLMRMIFRLVRRNRIPVVYTQGFNPHPKISLGPPLPLGVEGEMEFFDMTISRQMDEQDLIHLLKMSFESTIRFRKLQRLETSSKINWESEGREMLEIYSDTNLDLDFKNQIRKYNETDSFPITRRKKEQDVVSELKDIILDMKWENNRLYIDKMLKGASVF